MQKAIKRYIRKMGTESKPDIKVYDTFPEWLRQKGESAGRIGVKHENKIHHLLCGEGMDIITEMAGSQLRIFSAAYRVGDKWTVTGLDIKSFDEISLQETLIPLTTDKHIIIDGNPVALATFIGNEGLDMDGFRQGFGDYAGRKAFILHFTGFRY